MFSGFEESIYILKKYIFTFKYKNLDNYVD